MGEFLDSIRSGIKELFSNKKNLLSLLVLGVMILSLYLFITIKQRQIIQSRAAGDPIVFTGDNVKKRADGTWVATNPKISLQITSPFGPPEESVPSAPPSVPPSSSPPVPTVFGNFKAIAANSDGSGPYTFTWDRDANNTTGYTLRFNKDPQTEWLGIKDFIVTVNASAGSFTTGGQGTSGCYKGGAQGNDNNAWICDPKSCGADKKTNGQTCQTSTQVPTGLTCDGSYYNMSIENLKDQSRLGVDIKCNPLSAPANVSTQCTAGGQATLSWDNVNGAASFTIRINNQSNGWMEAGDMSINISAGRACSGGKCQFVTGPNSFGDIATDAVDSSGNHKTAPINLTSKAIYDWSIQGLTSGEGYPYQGQRSGGGINCP